MAKVIRVRTHSPDFLDESLRKLPAAAEVLKDSWDGDTCLVRIISDAEFIKYSIDKQGFGEIVPIEER
jgi:hypothetical protein